MCKNVPIPAGENQIPNGLCNGVDTSGWSGTANGVLTASGGTVTLTKNVNTTALCSTGRTITLPTYDWTVIMKRITCSMNTGDNGSIQVFGNSSPPHQLGVQFGNDSNGNKVLGTISIFGYLGASLKTAICATGMDTTQPLTLLLSYDSKYHALTCKFMDSMGRWKFKARIECDSVGGTPLLRPSLGGQSVNGAALAWKRIIVAKPNAIAIGDSQLGDGKFSPDPHVLNGPLTDDAYTWPAWFTGFPTLDNSDVLNRGHGGDDTPTLQARFFDDVVRQGCRVVFLHCSNNDRQTITYDQRSAGIQAMIDMAAAAGIYVVLINSDYGTPGNPYQTAVIDFYKGWWDTRAPLLTGVACLIDRNAPLSDGGPEGYIDAAYVINAIAPDYNWHLNAAGAQIEGEDISIR